MKTTTRIILVVIVITSLIIAGLLLRSTGYLSFESFEKNKMHLLNQVIENYWSSVIIYVAIYAALAALSMPGCATLSIAGGFLFTTLPGTAYIVVAATLGAIGAFLMTRYLMGSWLHEKYQKQLAKFNQEMKTYGSMYLFTLRLIPIMPFFLTNILAGLTKIPLRMFIPTTLFGIIPGSFVYAFAGNQIRTIEKPSDIFSPSVILAFTILTIISVIPILMKKLKK